MAELPQESDRFQPEKFAASAAIISDWFWKHDALKYGVDGSVDNQEPTSRLTLEPEHPLYPVTKSMLRFAHAYREGASGDEKKERVDALKLAVKEAQVLSSQVIRSKGSSALAEHVDGVAASVVKETVIPDHTLHQQLTNLYVALQSPDISGNPMLERTFRDGFLPFVDKQVGQRFASSIHYLAEDNHKLSQQDVITRVSDLKLLFDDVMLKDADSQKDYTPTKSGLFLQDVAAALDKIQASVTTSGADVPEDAYLQDLAMHMSQLRLQRGEDGVIRDAYPEYHPVMDAMMDYLTCTFDGKATMEQKTEVMANKLEAIASAYVDIVKDGVDKTNPEKAIEDTSPSMRVIRPFLARENVVSKVSFHGKSA